jgi:hypothetical protein
MNKKISVDLTLYADVQITDEVCEGIKEQYPVLWEEGKDDPEVIARAMVYALINPRIPYQSYPNDIWDGVADLDGLITNIELED